VKKIGNLELTRVKVKDLKQHPLNPNQGDVGAIVESLEAHGYFKPVLVQKSTMHIMAGNHTVQACEIEGLEEIDVILHDVDDDQALRIMLADNETAAKAHNDPAILTDLLESLVRTEYGLKGTGFTGEDLDDLIAEFEPELQPDTLEEAEPTKSNIEKITRHGDVWILGRHRLICGDSTTIDTYNRLLDGDPVDLVITDPPYNVAYQGGTEDKLTIQNDNMSPEDFELFLSRAFGCMETAMKPGAPIYVFHPDTGGETFRAALRESGLLLKQVLVWVKQQFVLGRQDYNWQHEPILYGWKAGAAHRWFGQFNKSTVIDNGLDPETMKKEDLVALIREIQETSTVIREDRPMRNGEHPTMKPVNLVARLMQNSSRSGDIVLDPFGGSGSTLIAAEQLRRAARLIELDPSYCDVICNRYQGITGNTPILEATGEEVSFVD
jgi:DNA modification methylase